MTSPAIKGTDVVVLALALAILLYGSGGYGFYEPHEGHFGGVAREMLLRGDWVTPTLNGAPYLNKPPLLYWLMATSMTLLGVTEYAARLPLALTGWVGVVVAWKWARELWTPTSGRVAALMLSLACGWFMFTHQLLIDILLSTLLLATYYCLWRLVWNCGWVYFSALYVLLGLCILAKGPLMLVFPLVCGLGLALSRGNGTVFEELRVAQGMGVTSLVTLPWAIAQELANPGFLNYFLFNENLKRIADTRWPPDYEVSKVSALGYLVVTALWCAPWTLVFPQVIHSAWRDWSRGVGEPGRDFNPRSEKFPNPISDAVLLLGVATALPILLFLPLSSRLVYYSLPSVAPFVILCAGWWSGSHTPSRRQERKIAGVSFCLLGLGACSASIWIPGWIMGLPELSNVPNVGLIVRAIALFLGSGCLIGGIWMLLLRPNLALVAIFIGLVGTCITTVHGFVAIQDFRSSKALIETANLRLGPTTLWTFEGSRELGTAGAMSYYLDPRGAEENPQSPSQAPPGWARGKGNTTYRVVLVLTDGGPNRLPPDFPGARPGYAITKRQLQEYWDSPRSVVFVTDFLRKPGDPKDPPNLNLPLNAGEPLLVVGPRKLYGNLAARDHWVQQQARANPTRTKSE